MELAAGSFSKNAFASLFNFSKISGSFSTYDFHNFLHGFSGCQHAISTSSSKSVSKIYKLFETEVSESKSV